MDIESERWVAKKAEFKITEGCQRDIIVNYILPALGIDVRQKKVTGYVHEVGTDSTLTPIGDYSSIHHKYIKNILKEFKE